VKVYWGNYDGRHYAMVAAKNQREGAAAIGTSLYDFRNFYTEAADDADRAVALTAPGTVFLQEMQSQKPWTQRK
jgi:hypothetical protein